MKQIGRRRFFKTAAFASAGTALMPEDLFIKTGRADSYPVRLGGPVFGRFTDPGEWVRAVKVLGYSAAYCPVQPGAPGELIKAYRKAAADNNIIIAEAGVWNNLLDPDESVAKMNLEKNIDTLHLADEIGAICCVNISGARGEIWDGPYPGNYSKDTFDMIVETVRKIIDQVNPVNSFYTLEPMPYMLPDSPDSYLQLIKAIDRKAFAAHLDPVNMISSPQKYFNNAEFIIECFNKLGPYIKSIHAKDITILPKLTLHLEERRPGLGSIDYAVFLKEASRMKDVPFMLEHLETPEEYNLAADFVRKTGKNAGISFVE